MAKQSFDDIVPRRSIRSIPLRGVSQTESRPVHTHIRATREEVDVEEIEPRQEESKESLVKKAREEFAKRLPKSKTTRKPSGKRPLRTLFVAAALVVLVILGVMGANMLGGATITVTPKTASVTLLDEQFTLQKGGGAQDVVFQPLSIKKEGSVVVRSTGEKQVDERSSATIVIYNNHSSASQRLIKNTRFETPEGLVFRINQSVTVPGKTGSSPGSVEAVIYADETGEKYNIGLSDFTIPGFKGDPRYKDFYGRSKTPATGGFSGTKKIVSEEDKLKAKQDIEAEVKSALTTEIASQVPEGYVLFDSATKIEWKELPEEILDADQIRIKEEGVISAALIPEKALATYLARRGVSGYKNEPIKIHNLKDLAVTPVKPDFKPTSDQSITFTISGDALFVWDFDEVSLAQAFVGVDKGEFNTVLNTFSEAIESAVPNITPFWKSVFPDDASRIEIRNSIDIPKE